MKDYNYYLESLPITRAEIDRINEVLSFTRQIFEFDFDDIFICEMRNNEGAKKYTSLWLFTNDFFIECKDFLTRNDFDITPLKKGIKYCAIEIKDFNLTDVNETSLFKLQFSFDNNITGNLISTEENCKWALKIYKKYILPKIKKNSSFNKKK